MEAKTWKYIENSFEANTRGSRVQMNKIVADHDAKLTEAAAKTGADPGLATLLTAWTPEKATWDKAYADWQNVKASYGGSTNTLEGLFDLLQIKPGREAASKVSNWEHRIAAVAPAGSALYQTLLPRGRAAFTEGSRDQIITEVKNLGTRLSGQTDASLKALGTEVTAFYGQLDTARKGQQGFEGGTDQQRTAIETARGEIATTLYGNLGMLMFIYRKTPETVAGFFDLDTVRKSPAKKETPAGAFTAGSGAANK